MGGEETLCSSTTLQDPNARPAPEYQIREGIREFRVGNTKAPVPLTADPDITDHTVRLLRPEGRINREGREVAGIRRLGVLHCCSVIIKATLEHGEMKDCAAGLA